MIRTQRVGGIRFFWIGPVVISFCIKKRKNPMTDRIKRIRKKIKTAQHNLKRGNLQWT